MYFTLEFSNLHHRFRLVLALGLHFGVRSGFSLMRAWDTKKTEHTYKYPLSLSVISNGGLVLIPILGNIYIYLFIFTDLLRNPQPQEI